MPTLPLSFPPPKHWQDFELLTKEVAKFQLAGDFDSYGRPGQKQGGVDIYGWDKEDKNSGVQCKHKANAKATSKKIVTTVTIAVIDAEIKLADSFTPKLDRFIIATTSFRDTHLQDHIHQINEARKGQSLPKIELWSWDFFEEVINKHADLQNFYFENVIKKFPQYDKDKQILSLLKQALDRPAFKTEFGSENNCEDFIKAIQDTQRAFSTGNLFDRDGNPVSSAYPGKKLSNKNDRADIAVIEKSLQKIRDFTTENLRNGNISQSDNFLYFRGNYEYKISETLNFERAKIIGAMNTILKRNNFETINARFGRHLPNG